MDTIAASRSEALCAAPNRSMPTSTPEPDRAMVIAFTVWLYAGENMAGPEIGGAGAAGPPFGNPGRAPSAGSRTPAWGLTPALGWRAASRWILTDTVVP